MRTKLSESLKDWLAILPEQVHEFLISLRRPAANSGFMPARTGCTDAGERISLGCSCFALKTAVTLRLESSHDADIQQPLMHSILSCQDLDCQTVMEGLRGAFVDKALLADLQQQGYPAMDLPSPQSLEQPLGRYEQAILAETKQALVALAELGVEPCHSFQGFPRSAAGIERFLRNLDWSKPWAAGGQAGALTVFAVTQAPRLLPAERVTELRQALVHFFEEVFLQSEYGRVVQSSAGWSETVNGTMKILSALQWLDTACPEPEKLIDLVLSRKPELEGCHLLNAAYVLYRLSDQAAGHRRDAVYSYCLELIEMIRSLHRADGGFSYYPQRSQTHYYGVQITGGLAESDIHATCLLTWALALLRSVLEIEDGSWQVIRP